MFEKLACFGMILLALFLMFAPTWYRLYYWLRYGTSYDDDHYDEWSGR